MNRFPGTITESAAGVPAPRDPAQGSKGALGQVTSRPVAGPVENVEGSAVPSTFYRMRLWQAGLWLVRGIPRPVGTRLGSVLAGAYCRLNPRRRAMVVENLLPVLGGDRREAQRLSRAVFRQFASKVADLWRFEAGASVDGWFARWHGWETYAAAHARGRGVLLVTPHLGNWELGGPLLAQRGVRLLVITQAEPGRGLTELRRASRARWGIETVVVGQDAFAFVEIIKRLNEGATVALLLDRPLEAAGVTVELFGRPFRASVAPAELARASGCAVLGVFVPRGPEGYEAHVLPEFDYDRAALGNREGRRLLTQRIMRAFEPIIRQHLDQWYHFVPIWPTNGG